MGSRDNILAAVKQNQPGAVALQRTVGRTVNGGEKDLLLIEQFMSILQGIGGRCLLVNGFDQISMHIKAEFADAKRIVSTFNELHEIAEVYQQGDHVLSAENVDVAVLKAHLGVAENGAVWLTEDLMRDRSLPFICQHLMVILPMSSLVADMHEAYEKTADFQYNFSIFIAGPSKTADIEQSLVLGAHGAVSMTVFLLQ